DLAIRGTEGDVELDLSRFGDLHGGCRGLESAGAHLDRILTGGEAAHAVASVAVGLYAPVRPGNGDRRSLDIAAEFRVAHRAGDVAGAGNRYCECGRDKEKDDGSLRCTTASSWPFQCWFAGKHCYPPRAGAGAEVTPQMHLNWYYQKSGSAADYPMVERYCNDCCTASGFSSGVPSARLGRQAR